MAFPEQNTFILVLNFFMAKWKNYMGKETEEQKCHLSEATRQVELGEDNTIFPII